MYNANRLPSSCLSAHPGDWPAVLIDITQCLSSLTESQCGMLALCLSQLIPKVPRQTILGSWSDARTSQQPGCFPALDSDVDMFSSECLAPQFSSYLLTLDRHVPT